MRIHEIRVNSYGPLSDIILRDVGAFSLIYGENESGKTLLLDAILRFMLSRGSNRKLFGRLDRVEYDPNGYLDLILDSKTHRLPDDGSLPDLLGVHAADLRNVLVVRASDLQVHEGQDRDYYAEITDRLMGIHREPIRKIRDKLHDIGQITSTGKISSTQSNNKLGSRIDDANSLLLKIKKLAERSTEIDMVAREADMLDSIEARSKALQETGLLGQARKRDQYNSGKQIHSDLEDTIEKIDELPLIEQDHYDDWRDAQNSIDGSAEELEEAQTTHKVRKQALEEKRKELKEDNAQLESLLRKESEIDEIAKAADRYRENLEIAAGRQYVKASLPLAAIMFTALLALAIIGLILERATVVLMPASIIFGGLLGIVIVALFVARFRAGRQTQAWMKLRLRAAEQDMTVDNIEDLLAVVKKFNVDNKLNRDRVSVSKTAFGITESQLEETQQQIADFEARVKEANRVLIDLKETTGVATFDALQDAMEKRARLETSQRELLTKLEERFGKADGSDEDKRQVWRERVDELSSFKKAAKGIVYSEDREKELSEQKTNLEKSIGEIEDNLDDVKGEIAQFASEANRVLIPDEQLPGDTLEDLVVIEKKLQKFVEEVEMRAHLAWTAIEIFNDIQDEEEQKVKGLFGEDDIASEYFRIITDGPYKGVMYEPSDGELKVIRSEGNPLRAYTLSSGTYDQLYLATRLSLAHRIFQGKPGFLLLDDPFLTSDRNRLSRQFEILHGLVEEGWQIMYFSVKEEVLSELRPSIDKGFVKINNLSSIYE